MVVVQEQANERRCAELVAQARRVLGDVPLADGAVGFGARTALECAEKLLLLDVTSPNVDRRAELLDAIATARALVSEIRYALGTCSHQSPNTRAGRTDETECVGDAE